MPRAQIVAKYGHTALDRAVATGALVRILPGIYCAPGDAGDPIVRARAVTEWVGAKGAVTGLAALAAWRMPNVSPKRVAVTMPPDLHRLAPTWVTVIRTGVIGRTFRIDGVRVVEPEFALVHAWNAERGDQAAGLVIDSVRHRVVVAARVRAAAALIPRVRAREALEALLALLDGGVTSYLEYLARSRVFTPQRFPTLIWQHKVRCAGRNRYLDAFDPEALIALEFDGRATHGDDRQRRDDLERDADVAGLGILTLRFTYEDITRRPQWCIDAYLAARRARIGR